jgi:hypothetical protein
MREPKGQLRRDRGDKLFRGYDAANRDRKIAVRTAASAEWDVNVDVTRKHVES